jgi:dTDP-glucose 4,6-dehydratase
VGALGTLRALGLAKSKHAGFMLASTSEVYGDPTVHPQPEGYWGNVNPIGPRGVYDEAKRYAEALTMAYHRADGLEVKIARIFNTYGPRMRRRDGRAVPTFIDQALGAVPMTVHGDGSQTRSLCYVDDLIEGIWRLLASEVVEMPVNIGIAEGGQGSRSREDDSHAGREPPPKWSSRSARSTILRSAAPTYQRPDRCWGWDPRVSLQDGLQRTIDWARDAWRTSASCFSARLTRGLEWVCRQIWPRMLETLEEGFNASFLFIPHDLRSSQLQVDLNRLRVRRWRGCPPTIPSPG